MNASHAGLWPAGGEASRVSPHGRRDAAQPAGVDAGATLRLHRPTQLLGKIVAVQHENAAKEAAEAKQEKAKKP